MDSSALSSSGRGPRGVAPREGGILPVEWLFRVKAATRDLVRHAGGLVRAGDICGYGKSSVDRWGSTDHVECIPLGAALLLEAETGAPLVTTAMAEINGRGLGPKGEGGGGGFIAAHIDLARQSAEYSAAVADAMEDGVITPNEQKIIDREAADVHRAAARVQDTVAGAAGEAIRLVGAGRGR